MKARLNLYLTTIVLLAVMGVAVGCAKTPTDAQITSEIQSNLNADSGLQGKTISVQAASGTVTLSGTVDNENQRTAAARYASTAPGVKQVINNLQLAPPPAPVEAAAALPVQETKPAPPPPAVRKPQASKPKRHSAPANDEESSVASAAPAAPAAGAMVPAAAAQTVPAAPATPPPPKKVTIPAGTTLAVRLTDDIDSEKAQLGQTFHATLDTPLAVEGDVVIPAGYDVEGHIVDVKSAGKFAGQSVVVLQLDRLSVGGKYYSLQTDQWKKEGSSRGKNTAAKVGAGAGIGAIIGAIAGGGKGAAIGAAAGGGLGGGVQAATKGQQIKLPPETVLNFALQAPLTVVPAKGPNEGRHKLEDNTDNSQPPQQ